MKIGVISLNLSHVKIIDKEAASAVLVPVTRGCGDKTGANKVLVCPESHRLLIGVSRAVVVIARRPHSRHPVHLGDRT